MIIDHICFAVKNINEGIDYWNSVFGYTQMTQIIENSLQMVKVVFLQKNNSILIKLIEPFEKNRSLLNFVNNIGGGFHHICFKCSDIGEKLDELSARGLKILVHPQPGEAFKNHNIAFLLAHYGLNLELIDTDEKAGLII